MIPKTLHYCWFGPAQKPKSFLRCLESWKLHCPDFELKEWNEETAKPYFEKFAIDALRKKHYAFVADAVRLRVLEEHGGVYLDTDMLLVKPIDDLLKHGFFTAYEVAGRPAYGLFGAVAGHPIIKQMAGFYKTERYNQFSPPVITHTFKDLVTEQTVSGKDRIYQPEYFYPMSYEQRDQDPLSFVGPNTYAVHLWDHSWKEATQESIPMLIKWLRIVAVDYYIHGYPWAYYKRYTRGFGRKLWHRVIGKKK